MSSNWINALDNCAAAGVLDFDAAAWLVDQPQRFVGSPSMEAVPPIRQPLLLPPGIKMKGQLKEDQFSAESGFIQNPTWKKVLFEALAIGATVASIFAFKKLHLGSKISSAGKLFKKIARKTWNYIKAPFTWIAKKFKSKPSTPTT